MTTLPPGRQIPARRAVLGGLGAGALAMVVPGAAPRAAIVNQAVIGKDGWLFPVWDEVRRADLPRLQRVVALINEAVGVLRQGRMEVAIVLTPSKARLYPEMLPDDFRIAPDADRRYAMALAALRRPGTLVPDLAAVLAAARRAQPDQLLFMKADTHWTAAGAETSAVAMAQQIRETLRLPASPGPGTQFGPPVLATQDQNDLADLLDPVSRKRYPIQRYYARPVLAAGPAALLDNDSADTVLVGNSFMQPKFGFAAMLSNQLARPVSLVWKVHRFGPWSTLLSTLTGEAFRRQRPKLLIWNFRENDLEITPDQTGVWGQNAMAAPAFLAGLRQAVQG